MRLGGRERRPQPSGEPPLARFREGTLWARELRNSDFSPRGALGHFLSPHLKHRALCAHSCRPCSCGWLARPSGKGRGWGPAVCREAGRGTAGHPAMQPERRGTVGTEGGLWSRRRRPRPRISGHPPSPPPRRWAKRRIRSGLGMESGKCFPLEPRVPTCGSAG